MAPANDRRAFFLYFFPFLVFESGEDNESCAYDDSEMGSVEESAGMSITGN